MPKVLMGEDAAVAMRLAGALFEEADLEVDAVTDGRALLEKVNARRSEYDLVVLGHDLPEIDGPSCVAFLKKMLRPCAPPQRHESKGMKRRWSGWIYRDGLKDASNASTYTALHYGFSERRNGVCPRYGGR